MHSHRWRALGSVTVLVLMLVLGFSSSRLPVAEPPPANGPVRLAVLLVFDQLRGDYPGRWQELFVADGFNRLLKEGAWFQNCHYPYSQTFTGPGHASLATGCSPWKHGIILNDWLDRPSSTPVYCATLPRYQTVPPPPPSAEPGKKAKEGSGSPERLQARTLADALKDSTAGKARVVALSLKDRSAVLPGGLRPDACYWFEQATGGFVTSTYYREGMHPWVEEFNQGKPADRWYARDWQKLRPDLDYARYSGPDDASGEGTGSKQGRTFPHPMDGGKGTISKAYYDALYNSPFGNDLLLALVKKAIEAEHLGQHETPDLLCLSFSSNDQVGHSWGPDSQEVLDTTLRTDRLLRDLLRHLDTQVGKGRYIVALSADHGVCPLPEQSRQQGKDARRLSSSVVFKEADAYLQETFPSPASSGVPALLKVFHDDTIYLNPVWLRLLGLPPARAETALARWLEKQPGILRAFTRTQLLAPLSPRDALAQKVRRSFHPERSGDVILVLQPYCLMSTYLTGTTHGTPHSYDTHVPLLVYGPHIRPQVRTDAVTPQAATVILAQALGIQPPRDADVPVPEHLFEE